MRIGGDLLSQFGKNKFWIIEHSSLHKIKCIEISWCIDGWRETHDVVIAWLISEDMSSTKVKREVHIQSIMTNKWENSGQMQLPAAMPILHVHIVVFVLPMPVWVLGERVLPNARQYAQVPQLVLVVIERACRLGWVLNRTDWKCWKPVILWQMT